MMDLKAQTLLSAKSGRPVTSLKSRLTMSQQLDESQDNQSRSGGTQTSLGVFQPNTTKNKTSSSFVFDSQLLL
jgi:hypothetical protein